MDKFVVDIDAVLDEFEESENKIQPPIMSLPRIGPQKTVTAPPTPPEASSPPSPPPSESEPSLPLQPEPEENLVDSVKLNGTTAPAETPIIEKELLTGPEPANTTKSVSVETTESTLVELEEMSEVEPLTAPKTQPVETLEIKPVDTPESTVMEALQPDLETTSDSKSSLPLEPEQAESSAAVKPKTPLKTQSTSSSDRTASPRVSSEQFEEFLRKKSLENAHLLSAHNSPVLQRYRSSSTGLSLKAAPTTNEALKPLEQNDALPPSDRARRPSQTLVGDEIDAHSSLKLPESRPEPSSGVLCPTAQQPTGEPSTELRSNTPELQIAHETEQLSEEGLMVEIRPDDTLSGTREVSTIQCGPKKDTGSDSINHGPLKSDASNFYRIVSFDMSAVEVTDDDLHLLEDEVQNDRAPSRRSQDSGASVEPVDPDQIIESEAAENVVNNNSIDKPNPIEDLDNPFDIPSQPVAEVPVQPGDQVDSDSPGSQSQDATTECLADCDAENDDTSEMTPQPDSSACEQNAEVNSDEAEQGAVGGESEPIVAPSEGVLGKVRPMWIHDEDAPICMNCGQDFTIFRRRHHCRACGKVLCGNCCKDRARLQFMDGELARVCSYCIEILNKAQLPPPTVMVPVGVLKKGGEKSNTSGSGIGGSSGCSKSVMFSDGIRPGGDLTDLDIPSTPPAQRAPQRTLKQLATGRSKAVVARKYRKYVSVTDSLGCLPNVLLSTKFKPYDQPLAAGTLFNLLQDPTLPPVSFELTRHKVQLRVKIVTLDCCLGSRVWSFCSEGLAAFGQEEIAFVLEYHADDELAVPRDVLKLYKILYENACRGAPVIQMDHLLFPGGLLSSKEHAGVLFLRTTLQCTQNILTPLHENNYLVAMLILRSEVPWAKLFPLRLLLRLGAELRYYPCPLVSQRFRKAVYFEGDQHSIMSILADFRNYQYTIQNIPGLVIHVVGKTYTIKAPRNRYDLMMKASTTNENILAIGSNFSSSADSHLVCIQGEDGSFQSQTINIASLPVKVTGASFLVFSGALKSNSGYTAKSSIVEDGILVQIGPHDMAKLKQAIHAMENYRIVCKETKPSTETKESAEEEYVELLWTENEVTRNESVISVIDGSSMAGIPSCKIFSGTDYSNDKFVVRWTELFFLASKDTELDLPDPNRLIEATARSMCVALLPHAAKLYEQDLKKVALRISLDPEQFGYELGAGGERLSGEFLGEVDSALVPIITSLDGSHQPMTIELVFYVLLK